MNPVMIPGLYAPDKAKKHAGHLLRKPRAPRTLPPITPEDDSDKSKTFFSDSSPDGNPFADVFNMFDLKSDDGDDNSSPPCGSPNLISPPPSESVPTRLNTFPYRSPVSIVTSFLSKDDEKYVLDPLFRGRTNLGTYVDGKNLVKPLKPRGPDSFPRRAPRQVPEIVVDYECDDVRFRQPPAFTLEHFMSEVAEKSRMPLPRVREIVYSRHNARKLADLILQEKVRPCTQTKVHTLYFDPEEKKVPLCEPRVPQHQLLLEMAYMIKQHMRQHLNAEVRAVIRPAPKFSPSYHAGNPASMPHTEILLYEDSTGERQSLAIAERQESEAPGTEVVIHSARSRYFQDSAVERSRSPFAPPEDGSISPSELAILDCLIAGGAALSLKAHFIDALPDIKPLSLTLVYLNLSFNDFRWIPAEVLDLQQLEVLKLRDNPLGELPRDLDRLANLRVLTVPYCLLTALPDSLFSLEKLEHLNLAYNKLTHLPNEIGQLQSLQELNVEGNMLPALPAGILHLQLTAVRVRNNLMHPLFWKEHTLREPQRLMDLAMTMLHKYKMVPTEKAAMPEVMARMLRYQEVCDCCQEPRHGPGLTMIRPVPKLFGVKHLPIMFRVCSPTCYQAFRGMGGQKLADLLYGVDTTS